MTTKHKSKKNVICPPVKSRLSPAHPAAATELATMTPRLDSPSDVSNALTRGPESGSDAAVVETGVGLRLAVRLGEKVEFWLGLVELLELVRRRAWRGLRSPSLGCPMGRGCHRRLHSGW